MARRPRMTMLALMLSTLLGGAAGPAAAKAARPARPNFLVIVADDLGFSDLGAFGGEIATLNLDRLAMAGVRLAGFHTESACAPTRAMLLTGGDSHRVGVGNMPESMAPNQQGKPGYEGHLRPDTATIAERLSAAGYRTLMSGKWHLGVAPEQDPHARGFQHSFAMLQCCHNHFGTGLSADPTKMSGYREDGVAVTRLPADFYSSDAFADRLIARLREEPGANRPFFAYLAFTAPHAPLQAPAEAIAKYKGRYDAGYDVLRAERLARQRALGLVDPAVAPHRPVDTVPWTSLTAGERAASARKMEIYAAMVDRLDQAVGRVIEALKASGALDDTVIVFLSDNGAEARDTPPRGGPVPLARMGTADSYVTYGAGWAQAATAPSWRFKTFATEGGLHTPAFVSGRGIGRAGSIGRAYVNVADIVPTLLDMAGVTVTPGRFAGRRVQPIDGLSWTGFLKTGAAVYPADRAVGSELFGSRSLRRGDWKLTDLGDGRWRLFDLAADPGETADLASREPKRMGVMLAAWDAYAKDVGVVLPDPPSHPNPPKEREWRPPGRDGGSSR